MGHEAHHSVPTVIHFTKSRHPSARAYSSVNLIMSQCLFCNETYQNLPQHKRRDHGRVYSFISGVPYDHIIRPTATGVLTCPDTSTSLQQCLFSHKNFAALKKHFKEHGHMRKIDARVTLWEDPPQVAGMDVDSHTGK
ncbi:hypothetical protein M422DRAFT_780966 [Sphaerobolus stellatus SS14]|uniref:Uncharacterized protein n=1 Tax=Sphaerobolus stellatus (strain SS14) TaxID=990650 RepID=A0A0C9VDY3_SPHS4|nr:hypothetical protein M422DRAFT_780966 [Sphaerobolus stellatus SS14]